MEEEQRTPSKPSSQDRRNRRNSDLTSVALSNHVSILVATSEDTPFHCFCFLLIVISCLTGALSLA